MINGTVGTEGFIDRKYVQIINNVARHQSVMVNTPVSINEMANNRDYELKVIEILAKNGAIRNDQIGYDEQRPLRQHKPESVRSGRVERTRGT